MRAGIFATAFAAAFAVAVALVPMAPPAQAGHTAFGSASIKGSQVSSAPNGRPRVRLSWQVRCTGADAFGGVIALYSYKRRRVVSTPVNGISLPLSGSHVTAKTAGPGRYRAQILGASCLLTQSGPGSPPAVSPGEEPHVAPGPGIIKGPDFVICPTQGAGASTATWPLAPTEPAPSANRCGDNRDRCASRFSSASASGAAWPLVPVNDRCEPICISRGGQTEIVHPGQRVVPSRERCAAEKLHGDVVPLPLECPGWATNSVSWPVAPARGGCWGVIELFAPQKTPCGSRSSAPAWPLVPCGAISSRLKRLGVARFRMRGGSAGIVPLRLRPRTARVVRRLGHLPVRARITMRKGKRRVRTVRAFRLIGR